MKTGIELITQERKEQIEKHGRNIEDDFIINYSGELAMAADALITDDGRGNLSNFPSNWDWRNCRKMLNKSYKERLIIAGALIAAEIDRLQFDEIKKL